MKLKRDLVWEMLRASKWKLVQVPVSEGNRVRRALETWPIFYLNPEFTMDDAPSGLPSTWATHIENGERKLSLPFEKFVCVHDNGEVRAVTVIDRRGNDTHMREIGIENGKPFVSCYDVVVHGFQDINGSVKALTQCLTEARIPPDLYERIMNGSLSTLLLNLGEINAARAGKINTVQFVPERTKKQVVKAEKAMRNNMLPTWEYRLVEIDPTYKEPRPHQGGTHASPRQHERRGHYRHYKSGKVVWVEAHTVGDPTRGYIKHSYTTVGENK